MPNTARKPSYGAGAGAGGAGSGSSTGSVNSAGAVVAVASVSCWNAAPSVRASHAPPGSALRSERRAIATAEATPRIATGELANGVGAGVAASTAARSSPSSSASGCMPPSPIDTASTRLPTRTIAIDCFAPIGRRCTISMGSLPRPLPAVGAKRFSTRSVTTSRSRTAPRATRTPNVALRLMRRDRIGGSVGRQAATGCGTAEKIRTMRTPKCSPSTTTSPSANLRSPT